ncbi:MAG: glycosyltransferase family 39 protein [Deltaproteobacteria bacterium]|nr:glycosyltransferase family 39 protein [Deltaproteobacteria bacterium]
MSRWALVVAIVATVPYAGTLGFDFTYDDDSHIVQNRFLNEARGPSELAPSRYFREAFPDQGRPVLVLTHLVDRALSGGSPVGYHLQSVLWHAICSLFAFLLLRELSGSVEVAGVAAALFAAHPIHVEAVANASNREDPLSMAFVLALVLVAGRWLSTGRKRWLVGAAISAALAIFSKEGALVAPLLLALCVVCFPSFAPRAEKKRVLALGLVLILVFGAWTAFQARLGFPSLSPLSGGAGLEIAGDSAAGKRHPLFAAAGFFQPASSEPARPARSLYGEVRVHHAASVLAFYAVKLVVPWPLSAEYDFAPFREPSAVLAGAVVILALGWLTVRTFRKRRAVTFGLGWFWIGVLPVSAVPLLLNPVADRYSYLASLGACWLGGWALGDWIPSLDRPDARRLARIATVTLVGLFAAMTWQRTAVWRDDVALWEDAVLHAPGSARAHQNLGAAYLGVQRLAEAERELLRAYRLAPAWTAIQWNLGKLAERTGRPREAERWYRKAVETPHVVGELGLRERALRSLADVLATSGRWSDLDRALDEAEERLPQSATVHLLRGRLRLATGRPREALVELREASRLGSTDRSLHGLWARAALDAGELAEAEREARRFATQSPSDPRGRALLREIAEKRRGRE